MTVYIDHDERYPDYSVSLEHWHTDRRCEVPEEMVKRWQDAIALYSEAQAEMAEYAKRGEMVS